MSNQSLIELSSCSPHPHPLAKQHLAGLDSLSSKVDLRLPTTATNNSKIPVKLDPPHPPMRGIISFARLRITSQQQPAPNPLSPFQVFCLSTRDGVRERGLSLEPCWKASLVRRLWFRQAKSKFIIRKSKLEIAFAFLFCPCYNPRLPLSGVRIAEGLYPWN